MKKLTLISTLFLSFLLIILTLPLTAQSNVIKGKLYGVGQSGNLGKWNGTGFTDLKMPWHISSIITNPQNGDTWVVGKAGNCGTYRWKKGTVEERGLVGGWKIISLAFKQNGEMWSVGASKNVGKWDGAKFIDQGFFGDWWLSSIAFDNNDQMWCVGASGNIGKWTGNEWESNSNMDKWKVNYLAFDGDNQMWCVGASGNVGKWNKGAQKWEEQGNLGNWWLSSLLFLQGNPYVKAASGGWRDMPTGKLSGIRLVKGGASVEMVLGSTVSTNIMRASENASTSSQSYTESITVEKEGNAPLVGKIKATLGFSATQSESVMKSVKEQTDKSLSESKTWKLFDTCPATEVGFVRFAISEHIVRYREQPMSVEIDGKAKAVAQEYIDYSRVNYSEPYAIGSQELKKAWAKYYNNMDYRSLMSSQEYDLHVNKN